MPEWSDSVVAELNAAEDGLAAAVNLERGLRGDDFEQRLGEFLTFQSAQTLWPTFQRLGANNIHASDGSFQNWMNVARDRTHRVVETIRRNLYANFGYERFDDGRARAAYDALRAAFAHNGAVEASYWFATTNYDCAIEAAFSSLNYKVLDGFEKRGLGTPVLSPQGIAETALQSNGHVPVLHLHGAVGWYRSEGGYIQQFPPDQPYNSSLGVPALLLPDNRKTATSLVGGEALWEEFDKLLDNATHLMFLGHSLHDQHLVDLVRTKNRNTAVVIRMPQDDEEEGLRFAEQVEYVTDTLPDARWIAGEFSDPPLFHPDALQSWLAS
jgi:hypothetical protein